jgi:hypothetical protein
MGLQYCHVTLHGHCHPHSHPAICHCPVHAPSFWLSISTHFPPCKQSLVGVCWGHHWAPCPHLCCWCPLVCPVLAIIVPCPHCPLPVPHCCPCCPLAVPHCCPCIRAPVSSWSLSPLSLLLSCPGPHCHWPLSLASSYPPWFIISSSGWI